MGHPSKFQRLSRLGSVTARHSSSGRQPNFAGLNRGRHLYSAWRPSRWALAHILVSSRISGIISTMRVERRACCYCFGPLCLNGRLRVVDRILLTVSWCGAGRPIPRLKARSHYRSKGQPPYRDLSRSTRGGEFASRVKSAIFQPVTSSFPSVSPATRILSLRNI